MEAAATEKGVPPVPAPPPEATPQPQPKPPLAKTEETVETAEPQDGQDALLEEDDEELVRFRSLPELQGDDYTAELARVTSTKSERRFQLGVTEFFFPWLRKLVLAEQGEELPAAVTTEQLVWGKIIEDRLGRGLSRGV